jgi:RNA polymerase sigma-70 factor (ECF subfamily)
MTDGTTYDEAATLAAARDGDKAAFGTLVTQYQRRAYGVAYHFLGNRDDALEVAQESFIRAYRAMDRFDTRMPFYPWLYRIIKNTSLNRIKKKKRRGESSLDSMMEVGYDVTDPGRTPKEMAAAGDVNGAIAAAMALLSDDHREILRLRHMLELSYSEIADHLGVPKGTVMSRLHGARKQLRTKLEEAGISLNSIASGDVEDGSPVASA